MAQVEVAAFVTQPEEGKSELTNIFNFTFELTKATQEKKVLPQTYEEAMIYLEGRRRHLEHNA